MATPLVEAGFTTHSRLNLSKVFSTTLFHFIRFLVIHSILFYPLLHFSYREGSHRRFTVLNFFNVLPHIQKCSGLFSEVPQPTMPTIIHSSIKSEPEEKHPAHNQQTNVYISKDEAPKLPNPEKIVIPISSLFPERSGHVSKPSHFIHEEQETKGK